MKFRSTKNGDGFDALYCVTDNFSFSVFSWRKSFLLTSPPHPSLLKISSLQILTPLWWNQVEVKDHHRVQTSPTFWKQRQFSPPVLWKRKNEGGRNANRTVRRTSRPLPLLQKTPWVWSWARMKARRPSRQGRLGVGGSPCACAVGGARLQPVLVLLPWVCSLRFGLVFPLLAVYRGISGRSIFFFPFCNCTKCAVRHLAVALKYRLKPTGIVSHFTQ